MVCKVECEMEIESSYLIRFPITLLLVELVLQERNVGHLHTQKNPSNDLNN